MNIFGKLARVALTASMSLIVCAFGFSGMIYGAELSVNMDSPDLANRFIAENDVTWTTLGTNENDSMPVGNGDVAANVWTEQNGDIVLLIAKSDTWSENGELLK